MLNNVQDLLTVFDIGNPEYEVLEYIEFDGTQYFDTGYYGDQNTTWEVECRATDTSNYGVVFGARFATNQRRIDLIYNTDGTSGWIGFGTNSNNTYNFKSLPANVRHNFKCDEGKVYIDGEFKTTISHSDFYTPTTIKIGCEDTNGTLSMGFVGELYVLKLNGFDYVPALDKNGKPCLYDRKNQTAIYARKISDDTDATDTLQYKKWVNKQDVEYIESTGTQYIDTGHKATLNTEIRATMLLKTKASNMFLFGARNGGASSSALGAQINPPNNIFAVDFNNSDYTTTRLSILISKIQVDTFYDFIVSKNLRDISYNGTSLGSNTTVCTDTFASANSITICTYNGSNLVYSKFSGYVKKFTILENGILIRDLQPVVYQGVACMYDKIYNKIYINAGTGAFKHGPFTKEDTNKYEVLKYITGDGTQFFETDYFATDSSEYQYRAMCYNDVSGARQVFGVITDNHTASVTGYLFNGINARWATRTLNNTTATANAWHDCILNKSGYTVDGVEVSFTDAAITGTSERPVSIIGITPASGLPSSCGQIHLSCFKIFENGVLVRDYIPVLDETFTPCLYDRANRVFLYHTNTEGSTTIPSYEAWNKKNVYYIESTGTQYIDSGIKTNDVTSTYCKFAGTFGLTYSGKTYSGQCFGSRISTTNNAFYYANGVNNDSIGNGSNIISITRNANTNFSEITYSKTNYEVTGTSYSQTGSLNVGSITSNFNFYLFGINDNGSANLGTWKYSSFKLYVADNLVRDFQPVVVQGTACMYDSVYNKAYTNAGTGVFIAGPDVDEPDERYEVLESITLNGTQCFDTGITSATMVQNDKFNITGWMSGIVTSNDSQVFVGCNTTGIGWFGIPTGKDKYGFNSSNVSATLYNTLAFFDITITKNSGSSFTISGTMNGSAPPERTGDAVGSNFIIGARRNDQGVYSSSSNMILKSCRFTLNGNIVRDYIPVLDSDGLPCLYDRVTKTFLYAKKISDGTDASATLGYSRWNKYDVAYIQSSGTQYIDTGYKPTKNTSFDLYGIDMTYTSGTTRFGSRTGTYSETFVLATIADSHFRWSYGTGNSANITDNVYSTQKNAKQISWNAAAKKCTITFTDGTTETSVQMKGTDLTANALPIYLFAFNNIGEPTCGTVKHTRIIFREGGTLIRDFKPVVWNSSSGTQACMYDEVYNKMYTNAGTGAFKAGIFGKVNGTLADIEVGASLTPVRTSATPPSSACPYIMTDIIPNDSIGCEFIFSVTTDAKGNYVIASRGNNVGRFYLYSNEGSTNIKYGWGTFETTSTATTVNHKYVMSLNKFMDKKLIADGTKLVDLPPVDFSGNTFPLVIFANNTNGTVACSEVTGLHGDLYYGFITLFNKVIREYIPARYNSTVGIFERKTGKFLTNDSTVGSFTFNDFS